MYSRKDHFKQFILLTYERNGNIDSMDAGLVDELIHMFSMYTKSMTKHNDSFLIKRVDPETSGISYNPLRSTMTYKFLTTKFFQILRIDDIDLLRLFDPPIMEEIVVILDDYGDEIYRRAMTELEIEACDYNKSIKNLYWIQICNDNNWEVIDGFF